MKDEARKIADGLTEAQVEWLLAMKPNTEYQAMPTRFYYVPPGFENSPAEYDAESGCLLCPEDITWLGSHWWNLSNDFIHSRLNETGLSVRAILMERDAMEQEG